MADPLAVLFGSGAGQADGDRTRLRQGLAQSSEKCQETGIAEELDIGGASLGLGKELAGGIGHQRQGMRGAPFDAQEEAGLTCDAWIGHGPSIFGLGRFASVAAWNWWPNSVWSLGMTENEQALHAALVELERAVRPASTGSPRPKLMPLFERIDALSATLPADTDRELLHFLHRKSYEKARQWLEERVRGV